ncbi:Serine/threonine-protein kinase ATG1 [Hypomontagnella monticulosa]|nr:Serine/threonine-protein kinase ATG1 [Hypomontagnella monticulosa]
MADPRTHMGSAPRRKVAATDETVGSFIIGSEIGKGSFAQVYMGKHKVTGELVAIKSVELARLNKKLKENLYSEIKILKELRHPHIVALHDCVESKTHINLAMEYCELGDLSLFIKRRDKLITYPATCDMARKYPTVPGAGLNEVVIRHFLKQLASALEFLRRGNFIHRDIKPQNLLLLPSPQHRAASKDSYPILSASHNSLIPAVGLQSLPMLKLADFGFARVLPATSLAETLCGSPLYMAPEILRYERYDAKADLWSIGTVAYEMASGKPPFRASNHVELLRKIESSNDQIKFARECQVTPDLKALIRALLKRSPVERSSFEDFFNHRVIADEIPGLVEDDVPRIARQPPREARVVSRTDEIDPTLRRIPTAHRRYGTDPDAARQDNNSPSPREKPMKSSPLASPTEFRNQDVQSAPRGNRSPRDDIAPGLGIRPQPVPSTSAPTRTALVEERRRRGLSNASVNKYSHGQSPSHEEMRKGRDRADQYTLDEREKAAQEIAFERDYVVVEKRHVEVNAFADELAAKGAQVQASSPKSGQIIRRATQQGVPTSTTGAIPAQPSQALQIAQGRRPDHNRRGSQDKTLSGSPGSTTSAIYNAISDASFRVLGWRRYPTPFGKGASPPHPYSGFPAYPTPTAPAGLITDGRHDRPIDEDLRVAQRIEDYAHQSDVVWGFAEVKYKQLVPLAPSMDHGLGGVPADQMALEEEDGLTVEAVVSLSEEALVLYVKALSLLAKSMDIANIWWTRKNRVDSSSTQHVIGRDATSIQNLITKVNSIVQWVRKRFNETLEKAEVVRLKLLEAQKQLPEDHPCHPTNNQLETALTGASSTEGIVLTAGLSAEKLMYERALEMSRAAAINEISNVDLAGCEISYVTAIRMLEAVLENDEDLSRRRLSGSSKAERDVVREGASDINPDDQQSVEKMIRMIDNRLVALRKKLQMIANASKAQQDLTRKRSGDVAPRSLPVGAS